MKRHPVLQPFSRDHNVGLVLALSLQTVSDAAVRGGVAGEAMRPSRR
jgi:hypothetical protein